MSIQGFTWTKSTNSCASKSSSVYISNQAQKAGSCLLLIDPQVDFIDENGSLKVDGAKKDCERVAGFIESHLEDLKEIYVTLDSHARYHIAHPMFWINSEEKHPDPFTAISNKDVKEKKWIPVDKDMATWADKYTAALETQKRLKGLDAFMLTIWPPHCLIGTIGHSVEKRIAEALEKWEIHNKSTVHYVMKGNNSKTEHYSAFRAEVIVPDDPATKFNENLYKDLVKHDAIYVAGQAQSHCVNFTVRDLVDKMGVAVSIKKLIILEGSMSPVGGFEAAGKKFIQDMKELSSKPKSKNVKNKEQVDSNSYGMRFLDLRKEKEEVTVETSSPPASPEKSN